MLGFCTGTLQALKEDKNNEAIENVDSDGSTTDCGDDLTYDQLSLFFLLLAGQPNHCGVYSKAWMDLVALFPKWLL